MLVTISSRWSQLYPGASIGILTLSGVSNPKGHTAIEARKQQLEEDLRTRFSGFDRTRLKELPRIAAYDRYYGKFGKSFHVLMQLESIALKGKHLPSTGSLVDNMFVAELRNTLLTAGHDFDCVTSPLAIDVATGLESYTMYNGKTQLLKQDDMFVSDSQGILSSILHGPDQRTRIKDDTKRAMFVVYAPPGISSSAVRDHLSEIQDGIILISPSATTELFEVYEASAAPAG